LFLSSSLPPPPTPLFPYTTLFRSLTNVHDDIVDTTRRASNELGVGFRSALEMHAAHRSALACQRVVALHWREFNAVIREGRRAPGPRERPAAVAMRHQLDQLSSRVANGNELHGTDRKSTRLNSSHT